MFDVNEFCFERLGHLLLSSLKYSGVTKIEGFSVKRVIGSNTPLSTPKDIFYFTAHTNVGDRTYSVSSKVAERFDTLLKDDEAWNKATFNLEACSDLISVTFFKPELTVIELFPQKPTKE